MLRKYTPGSSTPPPCPCCRPRRFAGVRLAVLGVVGAAGIGAMVGIAVVTYRWIVAGAG